MDQHPYGLYRLHRWTNCFTLIVIWTTNTIHTINRSYRDQLPLLRSVQTIQIVRQIWQSISVWVYWTWVEVGQAQCQKWALTMAMTTWSLNMASLGSLLVATYTMELETQSFGSSTVKWCSPVTHPSSNGYHRLTLIPLEPFLMKVHKRMCTFYCEFCWDICRASKLNLSS